MSAITNFLNQDGLNTLWSKIKTYISNNTVAKETGKGLSTNDFTAAYKSLLDSIDSTVGDTSHLVKNSAVNKAISDLRTQIGNLKTFNIKVVTELPTSGQESNVIYLIKHVKSSTDTSSAHTGDTNIRPGAADIYDEYLWVAGDGKFEKIGNTDIAASNVTYNHSDSKLNATNVQQAVDEIASAVATETSRAQEAEANRYTKNETYTKEEVNNLISTKTQIFDISAYHATGGTLATYDNLEDALGTNGENIPQSLRKGGMSVKFVQKSSGNKYVQYRLMSDTFNTTESNWQGVDNEPTPESNNLIKSGGVSYLDQAVRKGGIRTYAYYEGATAVGETFDENSIHKSGSWVLYSMDCQEGDVINCRAYAKYLLIVDSDNKILRSINNPFGNKKPAWYIVPNGGVHIYLYGQASQENYLYLYPKMSIKYKDYEYNMFLDVARQGTLIKGLARFSYNVPFKFYEDIDFNNNWLTRIISVEYCSKVLVSGYGQHPYTASGEGKIYAYVFLNSELLPISGPDRGDYVYENILIDVPDNAKYCVVTTQIAKLANCVLCAVTDKDNELLKNVVSTQKQALTDTQKETVLKNLGITANTDVVFNIENKGYDCNALDSNIGDVVTPVLVANGAWCSNILDVKEGDEIYFHGYSTKYIVLNPNNIVISKGSYAVWQEGRIVIPENGVKFVYSTFSSQVRYIFLVTYLAAKATNNLINNTVNREPINVVSVKKDGTGDYTTIQAAINAVKGKASINNQYQIRIYDDWKFEAQDLHFVNSGDCAVETANYVHLYGMNGVRTLEIIEYNGSYQVLWWIGNSNLENLHFKIKNSRYAVHQSGYYTTNFGTNPKYITRKAVNCIFEIEGGSNIAVGTDIQNGEDTIFEGCTFIGRLIGWYGHSSLTSYNSHIQFNNCTFKVPFGKATGIMALDSVCTTTLTMNNCKLDPTSFIENMGSGSYGGGNGLPVGAVFPNINVFNCGDYLFKANQGNYLRFQAPQNVSISLISGTAYKDVFGGIQFERSGRNNLSGVLIGENFILYQASNVSAYPYHYSLGCRLGDCSVTNKTLIVTLSNGQTATITFDKAYTSDETGVSAPAYTNEQIIAEMNTVLSGIGVTVSEGFGSEYDFYPNTDKKEYVAAETNLIPQKKFVHIKENGLAELANGSEVDGFALADIPVMPSSGTIDKSAICTSKQLLLGQIYSPACQNTADGTKFTITNGELVEVSAGSTDYVAIVYNNILKLK